MEVIFYEPIKRYLTKFPAKNMEFTVFCPLFSSGLCIFRAFFQEPPYNPQCREIQRESKIQPVSCPMKLAGFMVFWRSPDPFTAPVGRHHRHILFKGYGMFLTVPSQVYLTRNAWQYNEKVKSNQCQAIPVLRYFEDIQIFLAPFGFSFREK